MSPLNEEEKQKAKELATAATDLIIRRSKEESMDSESGFRFTFAQMWVGAGTLVTSLAIVVTATIWVCNYVASFHKEITDAKDDANKKIETLVAQNVTLSTQNTELKKLITDNYNSIVLLLNDKMKDRFTAKDWNKALWIADQRVAKGKPYSLPTKRQIDNYQGWSPADQDEDP